MRSTPTETLRKRQQCHDLLAQGRSRREIQEAVNSRKETVRDWLSRPRPTDADILQAATPAVPLGPVEILRRRQRCHDLHGDGADYGQLQLEFNVSSATVRDWLARPRPTDGDVEAAREASAAPKTDTTGQVGFKSRFDPELFARLRAESELQGAATNRVIGCAVRLYLDCCERARNGSQEPVDVLGYRA
jgi:transposase